MTDDTKSDKDMHKAGWMVPPRPNVPRKAEEARQIAKVIKFVWIGSFLGVVIYFVTTNIDKSIEELSYDVWSGFGGDLEILVPSDDLKNLKSLPYSITGNFSIDTGVNSIGSILIPFDISGEFPFSVDI
jgi:hypothetical protein